VSVDARTLAHAFDEEAAGFGEPPLAAPAPPLSGAAKLALAAVAAGLLALVVQCAGAAGAGTWPGMAASFGLLTLGGCAWYWLERRGTQPGIRHDGLWFRSLLARGALGWLAGLLMTGFYVVIYWFPERLGHSAAGTPTGLVRVVDPLARALTAQPASQWFLYGVLYTLSMAVFAVRMAMKYRHDRYQLLRTASVLVFQTLFAWLLPNLLVALRYPYMEFNGIWPLKHDYLWPDKTSEFLGAGGVGVVLLVWAAALVLATPVLTYFLGKRWYCSWVCGCGGLAETVGDPFRQLSSKSTTSWKFERWIVHGVLVLVVAVTLALWADHVWGWFGRAAALKQWYGFYIGAIFSGVAGVGLYPLLGNRVWCRFGCPQAAILGLWQRFFSRFRITTNGGQCISCGNCSTYCEMGIDVRSYAQRGENVVRASCVGCGVCAAVCPRGVLKLENGPTHADRFESSDEPLTALKKSLGLEPWQNRR
jgi:ferredoxin-type protein NapH